MGTVTGDGLSDDPEGLSLRAAVDAATSRLAAAGIVSARADAELLAAHLLGIPRGEVARLAILGGTPAPEGYDDLVAERAARVPLQHLTGRAAFRGLELAVGPGVFVPRPETEDVAGAAIDAAVDVLTRQAEVLVVDLCAGSAAIAIAVATEVPAARVVAAEVSEQARAWAAANVGALAPGRVDLRAVDVTGPSAWLDLADLLGRVDVVVSNPPYVPPGHVPVDPEVRDHDPEVALYGGGADGLAVPRAVVALAADLLHPGGVLVMEHADVQRAAVVAAMQHHGGWSDVRDHDDLTGRPRYVTATRTAIRTATRTAPRA
jgi:release factor glutamine methyltransferase